MIFVKQKLIDTVEGLGIPCYYARSFPPEKKDRYVTFYVMSSEDVACFDNHRHVTNWSFEVRYFDDNPERREEMKYTLREAMEKSKFITDGFGWDITRTSENDMDGFSMSFDYLETV